MRYLRPLSAALILASVPAWGQASPADTVERFYVWVIALPVNESGQASARANDLFGQELLSALEAQKAYEQVCTRLAPAGIKPHMIDQSPYFFWPDKVLYLQSTRTSKTIAQANTAQVQVHTTYDDFQWTDTFVLRREDERWVIVNIVWQQGSLTQRLVDFAKQPC